LAARERPNFLWPALVLRWMAMSCRAIGPLRRSTAITRGVPVGRK
jgi:hypothetical protein